MLLNKVIKNLQKEEKKSETASDPSSKKYPTSKLSGSQGFHSKKNSEVGAKRQRSMGNRNSKSS